MNTDYVIAFMLVSLIFIFILMFLNPFKKLTRFCLRSLIYTSVIFLINFFCPVTVGINPFTAIYTGFLGIWGVMGLYALRFIS